MPSSTLIARDLDLSLGTYGSIQGSIIEAQDTGEQLAKRFLNVPFALPPIGKYRWRKPRPIPDNYTYNQADGSPRDCREFGPVCPQPRYTTIGNHDDSKESEDCLLLNIWVPSGKPPQGGWPVVLWYHGGWLQVGNPSVEPTMDPTYLIASSGAALQNIFIASSYRLSALGFMASKELAEEAQVLGEASCGNYGLWDQRAALEWVHKFGHFFSGNAQDLTLAGRSAGAYSVHAQVSYDFFMAPASSPSLFKRLIMYSNAIPADPKTLEEIQPQFEELLAACSISSTLSGSEKLAALRDIPARKLISHVMELTLHTFRPIRDGFFFPMDLFDRFLRGDFAREFKKRNLKILIGEVRDEETLYRQTNPPHDLESLYVEVGNYYSPVVTKYMVDAYLNRRIHEGGAHSDPDPSIDKWKKLYGDIVSDGQVRAPSRLLVRQLENAGVPLSAVQRYMIAWRGSYMDQVAGPEFGVSHAFDKPLWNFSVMMGPTAEEETIMRAWVKNLVDFVHDRGEYGTKAWEEHKVLHADGSIGVDRDAKWDYLVTVADEMCTAK